MDGYAYQQKKLPQAGDEYQPKLNPYYSVHGPSRGIEVRYNAVGTSRHQRTQCAL